MTWLKLTSKALYLMDGDKYVDKQDLRLSQAVPLQFKFDFPKDWMVSVDSPRNLIIALDSTAEPQPIPTDKPKPEVPTRPFLRVVQTGKKQANGLAVLEVSLMVGADKKDSVPAVSGQPGRQAFRLPSSSVSGSQEPLPEGVWDLGIPKPDPINTKRAKIDKIVEFASGIKNNLSANWPHESDGLGPIYIEMTCRVKTGRIDIGFHCDNNADRSPGTIGCIGIPRDPGYKTLRKFASWFNDPETAPQVAIVDWGLGSIPK